MPEDIGDRESLSDAVQSHHTSPERFKLRRLCASDWFKMEAKRLNSSLFNRRIAKEFELQREQRRLTRTTSRTEVMFPCRTPIPIPKAMALDKEWTKLPKLPAWDESKATG